MRSNLDAFCAPLLSALAFAVLAWPGSASAQSIEVGALPDLDAWAVSGLSSEDAGLPRTLWTGSEAAQLAFAFDKTPAAFQSSASARLALRTLLSSGATPSGDATEALRKRYEAIARIGAAQPLASMTGGGAAARDPQIQQYGVQALLALGQWDEACGRARGLSSQPPGPFILRLRAACFAQDKDWPTSELSIAVARSNRADDPWLFSALPFLADAGIGRPPAARYDTSLNAATSLRLKLTPPPNALARTSALATLAIALSPTAPETLRPPAAARALLQGAISAAEARTAIAASVPKPAARGVPPARPGPLTAGVLAVEQSVDSAAKIQAVAKVLREARSPAQFAYSAAVLEPEIRSLPPGAFPGASTAMARAALALGDVTLARTWRVVAPQEAPAASLAAIDFAIAYMRDDRPALTASAADLAKAASPASGPQIARLLGLLAGRELTAPGDAQTLLAGPPTGSAVPADLKAAIADAQSRNAVGETALLVVAALAPGVETLRPADARFALDALAAVGLEAEARSLLLEGLVAGITL